MKRCPECRRDYYDDTLLYCLDDGSALLEGPASTDEPATAILSDQAALADGQSSESVIRAQIHTTGREADLQDTSGAQPGKESLSARRVAKPLVVMIVAVLILAGGFFGYRYFNAPGSHQINSIAVLPFQNRSDDADTEYLSDGLAESLIFRLTQLPGLKVSPASSVMRYKGKETYLVKIAAELGVDAVMTGHLAKRGDNLNITVELVDVRTNHSLWGEQYERKMSELLALQRELAMTVTQKLQLKLSGDEKGLTKKYTDSNEAYQLYLRGRHSLGKRTKDEMPRAIEYFQQAIKLDPEFALAYARISETYASMPAYSYMPPKEAFPPAKAAARKALEIDPTLPEAHTFLAYALIIYDFDWVEGERSFKRAIELDPNSSAAHFRYGQLYLLPNSRFDEAIAEIKRGLELEPLDITMRANLAAAYFISGQNDKGLEEASITYDLEPGHPNARVYLTQAYIENDR